MDALHEEIVELVSAPSPDGDEDPAAPLDDRELVLDGDRVALVIDDDPDSAVRAMDAARAQGFRAVVAPRGNVGLALAHELGPDVIVLSVPVRGGAGVLEQLKHHPRTRHIPVHVIADAGDRHGALTEGAAGFLERPADDEALAATFAVRRRVPRASACASCSSSTTTTPSG